MRIHTPWRTSSIARRNFIALALSLIGATSLHAQALAATGVRPLSFGDVLPGVPAVVHPTDPVRSGQFDIYGPGSAAIEITFSLPEALTGSGGARIPISFGGTSAGYTASGSISTQVFFDPAVPFRTRLSELGRGACFIGGTLMPPGTQRSGTYTVPLSITVAVIGL
jgi:hypothetical protein